MSGWLGSSGSNSGGAVATITETQARYNSVLPTIVDGDLSTMQLDVNGRLIVTGLLVGTVEGLVADNLPDTTKPVKGGAHYQTVLPTYTAGDVTNLQSDINGRLITNAVGNVVDNQPDHGAPVKVGTVHQTTLPTYANGDRADLQSDVNGRLIANVVGNIADNGVDAGNPVKVAGVHHTVLPTYVDGDRADLQVDSSGRLIAVIAAGLTEVVGNVASEDPDAGNPVKMGGKYDATLPTYTDGDRTNTQADINGRTIVNAVGNVADNAADSGNPIKFGMKHNAVAPTYADGDRADAQADENGGLLVGGYNRIEKVVDTHVGNQHSAAVSAYTTLFSSEIANVNSSTIANRMFYKHWHIGVKMVVAGGGGAATGLITLKVKTQNLDTWDTYDSITVPAADGTYADGFTIAEPLDEWRLEITILTHTTVDAETIGRGV